MAAPNPLEKPQRKGEELDIHALLPWMQERISGLKGVPTVTQFSGGASNWTYRLKFENTDLILRRAPTGKKAKGAHDMPREYHLQKKLRPHYPYVPEMLAVCEDEEILGSSFYLMSRMEGVILRKNIPESEQYGEKEVRQLSTAFWDKLVALHAVDYKKEGLSDLGKGEGYIERQIIGWNKRYADAATWNVLSGKRVMRWLENNMPPEGPLCICHNDYRLDNVVLDAVHISKIKGVLDWELAAIGDPLMDLGNSMAYWIEAGDDFFIKMNRRQPSNAPGMQTRREIIHYYGAQTGRDVSDFRFYRVYGLFRVAGIVQQIYLRYSKGFIKHKTFKNFWLLSNYLIKTCENVINKGV